MAGRVLAKSEERNRVEKASTIHEVIEYNVGFRIGSILMSSVPGNSWSLSIMDRREARSTKHL
jgi:hypothetical protein